MEIRIELLKIAKKDLQAAQVLYNNGLYPQAVFFFQQSVEKANKAYGLTIGVLKEENLYGRKETSINHETIKLYEQLVAAQIKKLEQQNNVFNNFPKIKSTKIFKKIAHEELLKKHTAILQYIKELRKEKRNPIHLSSSEISMFLRGIEKISLEFDEEIKNISKLKIAADDWKNMKNDLSELDDALPERAKTNPKLLKEIKNDFESVFKVQLEKAIRKYIRIMCDVLQPYGTLFYLSIITLPHTDITRYTSNDSTPVKIYTKKLPIVKMLSKLIDVQSKALKRIEHIQRTYGSLLVKQNN